MATFKELTAADFKTSKSTLNQIVDIVQSDVSGSTTRRSYAVFVTGGQGPGVTSSLFQTVYDADFSTRVANSLFDMTIGIASGSTTVANSSTGQTSDGLILFPKNTLMMRQKIANYSQHAQLLLGDSSYFFTSPFTSGETTSSTAGAINHALFIDMKRLFKRDRIKRDTLALRLFMTGASTGYNMGDDKSPNINVSPTSGSSIFVDAGSQSAQENSYGGPVGNISLSTDTSLKAGLVFYDHGIMVLDMDKVFYANQHMSGTISAVTGADTYGSDTIAAGKTLLGMTSSADTLKGNINAKFIPDFIVSASIDDIVTHIGTTRLGSGSQTAITFQNETDINSSLIFCRANSDEFNYSSNPTYVNRTNGNIRVVDPGAGNQTAFSFITTIGLYDNAGNLLAVAKTSRPVEKNREKDVTFRVRLDF